MRRAKEADWADNPAGGVLISVPVAAVIRNPISDRNGGVSDCVMKENFSGAYELKERRVVARRDALGDAACDDG
jgi:hypothetical protein